MGKSDKSLEEMEAELAALEAELQALESGAAPAKSKKTKAPVEAESDAAAPKSRLKLPFGRTKKEEPAADAAEPAAAAEPEAQEKKPSLGGRAILGKFGKKKTDDADASDDAAPDAAAPAPVAADAPTPAAPALPPRDDAQWTRVDNVWRREVSAPRGVFRRVLDESGNVVEEVPADEDEADVEQAKHTGNGLAVMRKRLGFLGKSKKGDDQ